MLERDRETTYLTNTDWPNTEANWSAGTIPERNAFLAALGDKPTKPYLSHAFAQSAKYELAELNKYCAEKYGETPAPRLRETKIILPINNNDGKDGSAAHEMLHSRLLDAFGGVTASFCTGSWRNEAGDLVNDVNVLYTVAV